MKEACKRHTKGDGSWWAKDARGIEIARVCAECETEKLASYRPEVLTDPNYDADEDIDGDDDEDYDPEPGWDDDSDESLERYYQSTLVDRTCQGCGSHFMGRPDHGYCNSCADIRERGGELPNAYD